MKISKQRLLGMILTIMICLSIGAPAFASGTDADVGEALTWDNLESLSQRYADEEIGSAICRGALDLVGKAYSQEMRYDENYVDCSSFVERSLNAAGISFSGTAAEQAARCVKNSYVVEAEQAAPGDLVFWQRTDCNCGRSMEIHHAGIYLGDGLIAEASSSRGEAVVRKLWETEKWQIAFYARVY